MRRACHRHHNQGTVGSLMKLDSPSLHYSSGSMVMSRNKGYLSRSLLGNYTIRSTTATLIKDGLVLHRINNTFGKSKWGIYSHSRIGLSSKKLN